MSREVERAIGEVPTTEGTELGLAISRGLAGSLRGREHRLEMGGRDRPKLHSSASTMTLSAAPSTTLSDFFGLVCIP